MANYELITISKGTIKTVDSFIKNFNAIGANMKALSVSAYKFLTDENKDVKIEFQKRVMDELNMSKSTLSFLKTAGWLYLLDERFDMFAYTNVVYFKKVVEMLDEINDANLTRMFEDLATFHNSYITEKFVESLAELSQKDLRNLIDKFVASHETEVEETEDEETEDDTDVEETEYDTDVEETEDEEQARFYSIIDEDYEILMNTICEINDKMSKVEIMNRVAKIKDIVERMAN